MGDPARTCLKMKQFLFPLRMRCAKWEIGHPHTSFHHSLSHGRASGARCSLGGVRRGGDKITQEKCGRKRPGYGFLTDGTEGLGSGVVRGRVPWERNAPPFAESFCDHA